VLFPFRGRSYRFALSHGLFSSHAIDAGSRLLLEAFSRILDARAETGQPLPASVLDAGSGVGVLGICAAGAIRDIAAQTGATRDAANGADTGLRFRAQDRDELARRFTAYNARRNGICENQLEAYAEPLLGGPEGARWDLILTNIPAKAGTAVLEDFVRRAPGLLTAGGSVLMVAVAPLAVFFRGRIHGAGCELFLEEGNRDYRIFGFRPEAGAARRAETVSTVRLGPGFFSAYPAYLRTGGDYELEGIRYHLDAVEGAAGFDNPGAAVRTAAKLCVKLGAALTPDAPGAVLIHEPDQGHFPVWFAAWLNNRRDPGGAAPLPRRFVLSGRNVLALTAAAENLKAAPLEAVPLPAVDIGTDMERLCQAAGDSGGYRIAVLFPDIVPGTGRIAACWEGLAALIRPGGAAVIVLPSAQADQADRKKPGGVTRLGDIKREGFRAMAFRFTVSPRGEAGSQNP
jgi:hypothetical protein